MDETKREGYIRRIENALKTDVTEITHEIFFTEEATREILELLKEPSAEPKQKIGQWKMKTDPYGFFEEIPVCSECGHTTEMRKTYNFCPNCGAYMRGEQDE